MRSSADVRLVKHSSAFSQKHTTTADTIEHFLVATLREMKKSDPSFDSTCNSIKYYLMSPWNEYGKLLMREFAYFLFWFKILQHISLGLASFRGLMATAPGGCYVRGGRERDSRAHLGLFPEHPQVGTLSSPSSLPSLPLLTLGMNVVWPSFIPPVLEHPADEAVVMAKL